MGLSNSQFDTIMRSYSDRQHYNQHLQDLRRAEIDEKFPQIKNIEEQIMQLSMDTAIAALSGEGNGSLNSTELIGRIKKLSDDKKNILAAGGYQRDYLEPIFTCPDCKDTGYIDNVKCHCFKKAITDLFYSESNAKNIRKGDVFDVFDPNCYSKTASDTSTEKSSYEHMKDVYNTTRKFADEFGKNSSIKNLLFYGDTGLGKTFLSNCIANQLINTCHSVVYLTAIEFFNEFKKHEFDHDTNNEEMISGICDCDLLIIDDLGTELANSFTNSRLFYCINDRILKDKSTIISTNLSLDKLYDQYSDRIFSRIMHSYKPLKFFGENIRLAGFKPAKLS